VIRGSVDVGSLQWRPYKGFIYSAVVPASAWPSAGITPWGATYSPDITQLLYKGARLQRARYPNMGGGDFKLGQNRFLKGAATNTLNDGGYAGVMPAGLDLKNADGQSVDILTELAGAQAYVKNSDYQLLRFDVQVPSGAESPADVIFKRDNTWGGYLDGIQSTPGYWLENKLWMLDKAGEWVFDGKTSTLYVWMTDGSNPSQKDLRAAVHDHAFVAAGINDITVQNLAFDETRQDALSIDAARGKVTLRSLTSRLAGGGGLVVTNSVNGSGVIDKSTVSDSAGVGIYLGIDSTRKIDVTNNWVSNAGLGFFADGAIVLGLESKATGNVVSRSSYIGIRGARFNTIESNQVSDSCLEFDDGGAIYVRGNDFTYADTKPVAVRPFELKAIINKNVVRGAASAPDRLDGAHARQSAVKGIYLDDFAEAVTVSNNTVVGDEYGVMIHLGRNNVVSGNTLSSSTQAQLWLQEDNPNLVDRVCSAEQVLEGCDGSNYLRRNTVKGNKMTPTSAAYVIKHSSDYGSTSDFAQYTNNSYNNIRKSHFALDEAAGVSRTLSFDAWKTEFKDTGSVLVGQPTP